MISLENPFGALLPILRQEGGANAGAIRLRLGTATATLLESPLQVGDVVLLLTEDDQTFYCMDKVVKQG